MGSSRRSSHESRSCKEKRCPSLPDGAGVHGERRPDVAVEILEGVLVHEPVVLRRAEDLPTGSHRGAHHLVDRGAALTGEGYE